MRFPEPLVEGRLQRRYKRFLVDVCLESGESITAHCPNTGSMLGCVKPGARVWLSRSENPARKYPMTWELIEVGGGTLVGINTGRTNRLVGEAVEARIVAELQGYGSIRREVRYGAEKSRIDLLLERSDRSGRCYVEVKNVTAAVHDGIAVFPDAVTARGARHLRELARMVDRGHRAVVFFCVQRSDVREVRPAGAIDPDYARTLREALGCGVEAMAYGAEVTSEGIWLRHPLPVVCP